MLAEPKNLSTLRAINPGQSCSKFPEKPARYESALKRRLLPMPVPRIALPPTLHAAKTKPSRRPPFTPPPPADWPAESCVAAAFASPVGLLHGRCLLYLNRRKKMAAAEREVLTGLLVQFPSSPVLNHV